MRNVFYTAAAVLSFAFLYSCQKDHQGGRPKVVTIDTTIASGSNFALDLRPYGDADDVASIVKQASDYTVSEITNSTLGFSPAYHYSAVTSKTTITDQVMLKIAEGNGYGRCRHHGDSTVITINFTVQ